jgi:hypothetical protein
MRRGLSTIALRFAERGLGARPRRPLSTGRRGDLAAVYCTPLTVRVRGHLFRKISVSGLEEARNLR